MGFSSGKMIFWCGGHANYPGNEIYLWNSYDGKWSRASLPSDIKLVSPETGDKIWFNTIDGYMNSPMASHTYQNNQFLPIADKFVVFGGAAHNNGGPLSILNANGQKQQTGPYFWNPAKADVSMVGGLDGSNVNPVKFPNVLGGKMWENRDNITDIRPVTILSNGTVFSGHSWLNGTAVYSDERPDADVIYISDIYELFKYTVVDVNDSSKDVWEKVGDTGTAASGLGVAAIEPRLNIYVRTYGLPLKQFGDSPVLCYWNLNIKNSKKVCFRPTDASGEFNYRKLGFYGMAYDPKRQQLILWDGTDKIWALVAPATLSPLGWHFEKIYDATMDGNQNVPVSGLPDSVLTGILGKWKYIPSYDIFIGVNTYLSGEVWAYKPKNWQPKLN